MNHMMVDLETLDTRPTSVVLSIGAVVFSPISDVCHNFYRRCSWQDQIDAGRTVSESTLRWWLKQSDEARAALEGEVYTLHWCLEELSAFYRQHKCERVWANGPTFDVSIIEHAMGVAVPWEYSAPRDLRTLRDLVPPDLGDEIPQGVAHNALADAQWQAQFVCRAIRFLIPSVNVIGETK